MEEFYQLNSRVELKEPDNVLVARFLGGLQERYQTHLNLQPIWSFNQVVNLALKLETSFMKCTRVFLAGRFQ